MANISPRVALQNNSFAIELAARILKNGTIPDENTTQLLNAYQGFGGIKAVLYPIDVDWKTFNNISKVDLALEEDVKKLYNLIGTIYPEKQDDIWASIKESVLSAFFTPQELVDQIFSNIQENNSHVESFLDPSAGTGVYIDKLLKHFPNTENIVAVEKDFLTYTILQAKFSHLQNVQLHNKGFEEVNFGSQKFDLIASNIPFGDINVASPYRNVSNKIHNFFFYHSANLLNKGGLLNFITSTGVMNSRTNKDTREELSKLVELQNIIALPNNAFQQSGTQVSTHIVSAIRFKNGQIPRKRNWIEVVEDDGVFLNQHIAENKERVFLDEPQKATNPYGQYEYNYQLGIPLVLNKLNNDEYKEPRLEIVREHGATVDVYFERHARVQNIERMNKEELFDINIYRIDDNLINFKVLSILSTVISGDSKPIAHILRYDNQETGKKNYVIKTFERSFDANIENLNTLLESKKFASTFSFFTNHLQEFCKIHNLKLDIDVQDDQDGENFKDYLLQRFNQPILKVYNHFEFRNFKSFKDIEAGMIALTNDNIVVKVLEVGENEDSIPYYLVENLKLTTRENEILVDYLQLINVYSHFLIHENGNDSDLWRNNLNSSYDHFVERHGFINSNLNFLSSYDTRHTPVLQTLEVEAENTIDLFTANYEKADIFFKEEVVQLENIPIDKAIMLSFSEKSQIDIDYISKITSLTTKEVLEQSKDYIIFSPVDEEYQLKSFFLSGNVVQKIKEIQKLDFQDATTENAIKDLLEVVPTPISYNNISKQFGSRWMPIEVLQDFVNGFYDANFRLFQDENTDSFQVAVRQESTKFRIVQGKNNRFIRANFIVESAYMDVYPIITYTEEVDGVKIKKTDNETTEFCRREIKKLKDAYENHLNNIDEKKKEEIAKVYNEKLNCIVIPKVDGGLLDLSDMNIEGLGIPEVYNHQKNAIWKSVLSNGGVVDHEVGLGKTLSMVGTSHYLKKMGVAKKPIMIGLKANVGDLAEAYKTLYPGAKILFATEKDFTTKTREVFLNKVKNSNWDAIIMSHNQFFAIPQGDDIQLETMRIELDHVEKNLFAVQGADLTKQQLQGLETKKKNLVIAIKAKQDQIAERKDKNVLSFDQLGIDHIIVDESHIFKNLSFTTRHNRVAGLGQTDGSQRADNLLYAIRSIQKNTKNNELGATFFSGTPISNSLTELYLIFKYLIPTTLREMGISNFDSWASAFAVKAVDFEANMLNNIVSKERFRYFINLPELATLYCSITDVMNGDLAGIDRPKKAERLLENAQTPLQKRFYYKLGQFLKNKDESILKLDKPLNMDAGGKSASLIAMDLAFKASIDMRLINAYKYKDENNSKINTIIRDNVDFYHKFKEQKATSIIFTDIGTSKKKLSFEEMEENYSNNIFTSVYDDIKYKLIKSGISENEIAFIQDWNSVKKKAQLSEKMNNGEIRILIGGTDNAGTGLNVQKRLGNIKHLTIPWKPSALDQRNGRGYRTGNLFCKEYTDNEIDISISATSNTLDNYKIDLNKNKAKFITQIRSASVGLKMERTADEGSLDEDAGMSLAEFQAQLSGDNKLLIKHKLEKQIKELYLERSFVNEQVDIAKYKTSKAVSRKEDLEGFIKDMTVDYNHYNSSLSYDDKGKRVYDIKFDKLHEQATSEQVFNYVKKIIANRHDMFRGQGITKLGEINTFDIIAKVGVWGNFELGIQSKSNPSIIYNVTDGSPNLKDEATCLGFFRRSLESISDRLDGNKRGLSYAIEEIELYKGDLELKFEKQDLVENLRVEIEELDAKIKETLEGADNNLDIETLVLDGKELEVKKISTLNKLEKATLKEMIGSENTLHNLLVSQEVFNFFYFTNKHFPEILTLHQLDINLNEKKFCIQVGVKDYDDLYVTFDKWVEKNYYTCYNDYLIEKGNDENKIVCLEKENIVYSYSEDAKKLNEMLFDANEIDYSINALHQNIDLFAICTNDFEKHKIGALKNLSNIQIIKLDDNGNDNILGNRL